MQPATRLLLLRTSGSQRSPDLGVPANERRLGGGEATEAAAEATAEEPPATVTTLLMRALRMEDSPVKIYGYPFRHVGVVTTWHLTDWINLYNGTINGWDRWIDERYIWGYTGGFAWTSRDAKTNVAFTCVTGPNQFPRFLPANQPNDWVQFGTPYNDGTRSSQLTLAFDVIFLFSIARSSGLFSSTNTACRIFSLPSDCRADTRKSIPDKEMWPSAFSSPRARACACSHVLSTRSTARHNKHNRYGPRRGEGAGNGLEWPCL
jgi:Putative beta-barrel porin-2, OmpL-like. bbp2